MKGYWLKINVPFREGGNILDLIASLTPNPMYIRSSLLEEEGISILNFIDKLIEISKVRGTMDSICAWEIVISKKPLLEIKKIYPT